MIFITDPIIGQVDHNAYQARCTMFEADNYGDQPRNVVEVHGAHAPTPDEAMFALQDWIQKITTPPEPEPEKCQAGLTLV